METLPIEVRRVAVRERLVEGIVVPYDEVTYLTPDPAGERVQRGAFARSLQGRERAVPLLRNHAHDQRLGVSTSFREDHAGLVGTFRVNDGAPGDALLAEVADGYLGALSAGFQPVVLHRAADGIREVVEGRLVEVSLVAVPAYAGAQLLSVRRAHRPAAAPTSRLVWWPTPQPERVTLPGRR